MKINMKKLKQGKRRPKEGDTCANCFYDTNASNLEPCISCFRNPAIGLDDKWVGFEGDDD